MLHTGGCDVESQVTARTFFLLKKMGPPKNFFVCLHVQMHQSMHSFSRRVAAPIAVERPETQIAIHSNNRLSRNDERESKKAGCIESMAEQLNLNVLPPVVPSGAALQ